MSMTAFSNDHRVRLEFRIQPLFIELGQRLIIRPLYREHAKPRDIHARLWAQFGDAAYSLRSVQRWCQYVQ
jgi:hypothetical protein